MSAPVVKNSIRDIENEFLNWAIKCWPTDSRWAIVGSACVVGVITQNTLYTANVGDCRAVLGIMSKDNKSILAERLTTDHNARDENIRRELKSLHPHYPDIVVPVYGTWRVEGKIQLSRSIGNVYFKRPELARDPKFIPRDRPVLTAEPFINVREMNQQ
eukprot:Gb_10962 [translate_table: standard]